MFLCTAKLNKGKILTISLAHFLNDWYSVVIMTLLPFLVAEGRMGVGKGAFLVATFNASSFLLQPMFGILVDRKKCHWILYMGPLWMAVFLSPIGLIKSYPLLIILAALAGLGTAAFHPAGSAIVSSLSGDRKGFFQAVFIALGNFGWAFTGLIVTSFTQKYGLELTPVFVLPGVITTILLWFTMPKISSAEKKLVPPTLPLWPVLRSAWVELTKIVLITGFWSTTFFGLVSFLPLYIQHENLPLSVGSQFLFVMSFSSAIGVTVGGHLSDVFGRKTIIVLSMLVACPLYYLFLVTNAPLNYIFLALASASLFASFSVIVVVAQETISKNVALAAGLILGFGNGLGSLGIGLWGILAEYKGISYAVHSIIWLPLLPALLGLFIRGKKLSIDEQSKISADSN